MSWTALNAGVQGFQRSQALAQRAQANAFLLREQEQTQREQEIESDVMREAEAGRSSATGFNAPQVPGHSFTPGVRAPAQAPTTGSPAPSPGPAPQSPAVTAPTPSPSPPPARPGAPAPAAPAPAAAPAAAAPSLAPPSATGGYADQGGGGDDGDYDKQRTGQAVQGLRESYTNADGTPNAQAIEDTISGRGMIPPQQLEQSVRSVSGNRDQPLGRRDMVSYLDETERRLARAGLGHRVGAWRGRVLQQFQSAASRTMALAAVAAQGGDMDTAARLASRAYGFIPDGNAVSFQRNAEGQIVATRTGPDGQPVGQPIPLNPQTLREMAVAAADPGAMETLLLQRDDRDIRRGALNETIRHNQAAEGIARAAAGARGGNADATQQWRMAQLEMRQREIDARRQDASLSREQAATLARESNAIRLEIAQMRAGGGAGGPTPPSIADQRGALELVEQFLDPAIQGAGLRAGDSVNRLAVQQGAASLAIAGATDPMTATQLAVGIVSGNPNVRYRYEGTPQGQRLVAAMPNGPAVQLSGPLLTMGQQVAQRNGLVPPQAPLAGAPQPTGVHRGQTPAGGVHTLPPPL